MADRARSAFMILKSKRQRTEDDEDDFYFVNKRFKKEGDLDNIQAAVTALVAILDSKNKRNPKAKDKLRDTGKLQWADVHRSWREEDFKAKIRINCTTFNFILDGNYADIFLTPANLKPNPTSAYRQIALRIYSLATGCTLSDLFGVSLSAASKFLDKICRLMVVFLYDHYVRLSTTDEEWQNEIRGFLENYEFSCVGAWHGFHVYINSQLQNYLSLKKRYSMTNLGLTGYNNRFLYAVVGAPGNTHDARLLKESYIYMLILLMEMRFRIVSSS